MQVNSAATTIFRNIKKDFHAKNIVFLNKRCPQFNPLNASVALIQKPVN